MVDVRHKRCAHAAAASEGGGSASGCTKKATHGLDDGSKKAEFCIQHAPEGMRDVVSKRCNHPGCLKLPVYCMRNSNTGGPAAKIAVQFCAQHAADGMVVVRSRRCHHPNCGKQSSYGLPGNSKNAEFCAGHARPGMIDFINNRCRHGDGCSKQPSFGFFGSKTADFCMRHAKEGMVSIHSRRCSHPGCEKRPSHGVPVAGGDDGDGSEAGGAKPRPMPEFCAPHAKPWMVVCIKRMCFHPGCTSRHSHEVAGTKRAELCARHAKDGMVDVRSKRCAHPGCSQRPSYGPPGRATKEFCSPHAEVGMVDVRGTVKETKGTRRANTSKGAAVAREGHSRRTDKHGSIMHRPSGSATMRLAMRLAMRPEGWQATATSLLVASRWCGR